MSATSRSSRARTLLAGWLSLLAMIVQVPALAQTAGSGRTPGPDSGPGRYGATIIARDVIVAVNDTMRSLARRELGRAGLAPLLAEFNELDESSALEPGQIVRVPIHVPVRGEAARVVFVKGSVTSNGTAVTADGTIETDDHVVTGPDGFLSIEFESGSVVNLQPDTEVTLQRLGCLESDDSCLIELETSDGGLTTDVESRDNQPSDFRIRTPYATAAVRGTRFDFVADAAELRVAVTEGALELGASGTSIPLPSGFGSVTREGEPPGPPEELLPAPVFRNVPTRFAAGDRVRWWPLTGVERYRATLTEDAQGVRAVADFDVEDLSFEVAAGGVDGGGSRPGDYYLTLRAVAGSGLPGAISTTPVTIAVIDDALAPPAVAISRERRELLVSVIDPPSDAAGFEIQVSTDANFPDPLAVDVGPPGSAVFRIEADTVYARARRLVDPRRVSAFGPEAVSE